MKKPRGGAHGVRFMSFPELQINLKVPYFQVINPYSKTNYINGVIPDIQSSSYNAFIVAQIEAANDLLKTETDSLKRYKLEWLLSGKQVDLQPIILEKSKLEEYEGMYNNTVIKIHDNNLLIQKNNSTLQEIIPMGNDIFKYNDMSMEKYRIQFVRDEYGDIKWFFEFDSDGDKYPEIEKNK